MDLKKLIEEKNIISFDIFDTLIKRNVNNPTDVFILTEEIYNSKNNTKIYKFIQDRIYAEKQARLLSNLGEISLDDIYAVLSKRYNKEQCIKLQKIEQKVELEICVGNKDIISYFNYAKKLKKKIILTSDMHLSKELIETILNKNGVYGYQKIYISSEVKLRKYDGKLFSHVVEDNKCGYKDMLHIGDNIISDVKMARNLGIQTFHIKESGEGTLKRKVSNRIHRNFIKKNIYENFINNFINNNYIQYKDKKYDKFYYFGYKFLGPLLYGFLDKIHNESRKKKLEHLYFFSRDGYLLKEAYDNYFSCNDKLSSTYLFVSRKALLLPSIKREDSLINIVNKLGMKNKMTVKEFLTRISNNIDIFKELVIKNNYSLDSVIDFEKDLEKTNKFYSDIKNIVFDNIENQRELLIGYLEQEDIRSYKNVGIMDLGWRGSLQFSLDEILKEDGINTKTYGFYLGLNEKFLEFEKLGMLAEGYLFMPNDIDIRHRITGGLGVVELLFSAQHGSVLGYKKAKNEKIEAMFDEIEYSNSEQLKIKIIQDGALAFIKDFSKVNINLKLDMPLDILTNNILQFISNPKLDDVNLLGNFTFYNFNKIYLANPQSLYQYVIHPNVFIQDFNNSTWKIGFMKKLLKIRLPYFNIYKLLKVKFT